MTIDAPSRPADEVLSLEDQSVGLSVWFIDYGGPIENRGPDQHDDVRWISLDAATKLDLADAEYIPSSNERSAPNHRCPTGGSVPCRRVGIGSRPYRVACGREAADSHIPAGLD